MRAGSVGALLTCAVKAGLLDLVVPPDLMGVSVLTTREAQSPTAHLHLLFASWPQLNHHRDCPSVKSYEDTEAQSWGGSGLDSQRTFDT